MRIGIDARSLAIEGGVKTYLINLINELSKLDKTNQYYLYYDSKKCLGTFNYKNFKEILLENKNKLLIPFWEQITLRNQIIKDELDIFHGPKNTIPLFLPKKIMLIVTVLDLTPFILSGEMKFIDELFWKLFLPLSVKKANKVICISNATKNDLINLIGTNKEKINVIYLGTPKIGKNCKKKISKNYFLIVGALRPRKNIERILFAFNDFLKINKNFKLIIVGKNLNNSVKIKNIVDKLNLNEKVNFVGVISQSKLNNFYSNSTAYLYPSLYEGFGLPILEAQALSCPVITSNISSMPEIAGNGAIMVNPRSISDITLAMEKIVKNNVLRLDLIKKGKSNIKKFNWKKCAKETLLLYQDKL